MFALFSLFLSLAFNLEHVRVLLSPCITFFFTCKSKRNVSISNLYEVLGCKVSVYWLEVAGIQALVGENEKVEVDDSESGFRERSKKQQAVPNQGPFACPSSVPWLKEIPQTDLYIKSNIMTVLAMDGRRRVMDIEKHVSAQAKSSVLCLSVSIGKTKSWVIIFALRKDLVD